jgi:hypothetical protein
MTIRTILVIAIGASIVAVSLDTLAGDKPVVNYVGNGRYTCSGNSTGCAQIDQNNREQGELELRRYEDKQARAQAYVDHQRQKEDQERAARQRSNP